MKIANINIDVDTFYEDAILTVKREEINDKTYRQMVETTYHYILPRILNFLDKYNIKANFMIIGRDALICPKILNHIINNGHEIGNHTQSHPKNFSRLSKEVQNNEIVSCQKTIKSIIAKYPESFRCPGYTITPEIIGILHQNFIDIDISMVNSLSYLFIKKFYKMFLLKNKDAIHIQNLSTIFSKNIPHFLNNGITFEFPVSNSPILNIPLITSLLFHFGFEFGKFIIKSSIKKRYLNINLHVIEFVIEEDISRMNFPLSKLLLTQKYLSLEVEKRLAFFNYLFNTVKENYNLFLLSEILRNYRGSQKCLI